MIYNLLLSYFIIIGSLELVRLRVFFKALIFIFSGLMLIVISGVRWKTGADWSPYYNLFKNNETFSDFFSYLYEPGYLFLNAFTRSYSDSYTVFLFSVSFIVILLKYRAIWKCSPYPLITCLVAFSFYQGDLFPVRQSVAIAITLFSTTFILERKKGHFLVCMLLAISFHYTSIIFVFSYYLSNIKINSKRVFLYLIISFTLMTLLNIGELIMNLIGQFIPIVKMKLDIYKGMDVDSISNVPLWVRDTLGFSKRAFFIALFLYVGSKVKCKTYDMFLNLYIASIFMTIILSSLHPSFNRMTMYYSIFEIFLLSYIPFIFKNSHRVIIFIIIAFYCSLKFFYGFSQAPELYFPFETIFDSEYKAVF